MKVVDDSKSEITKSSACRKIYILHEVLGEVEDQLNSPVYWRNIGVITWKVFEWLEKHGKKGDKVKGI